MSTRAERAAEVFGVAVDALPEGLCRFGGISGPGAARQVLDELVAVVEAAPGPVASHELGHIAFDWPARPPAGTPLSAHAVEVGNRIANLLTSRSPGELREIGRALGLLRHRLAWGLLHALHAHDSEQEWLEAATGSTRAYGVWDVEAQVADDLHTDDLVADLAQGISAEEPAAWSDAQVRGVEAALLWELCQLAGHLLNVTARPSAAGELWQVLGEGRLVAHRKVAGASGLGRVSNVLVTATR